MVVNGGGNMNGDDSLKCFSDDEVDFIPLEISNGKNHHHTNAFEEKKDAMEKFLDRHNESDNVDLASKHPVNVGRSLDTLSDTTTIGNRTVTSMWRERFLVSFMVDARGGAMHGCRHSGVRVIIPPRRAPMPMRIYCRYLKQDRLIHPPVMMDGEGLASRILELGPAGAKFLGPVIIEVPHFAALCGQEREIVILRSDDGETWTEHNREATQESVHDVLQESFDADELNQLEDLHTNRITRILTTDFPRYFAIVSRIRQEVHGVGPEGGLIKSKVVPQVQLTFPQGALTKTIKIGIQTQSIPAELTSKLLGQQVAVSPIVTVEPRRRKFHKAITVTIPVPRAPGKGKINQYTGEFPTLRLLCSITGGASKAQWEDITGSTSLTLAHGCANFTTTVSARYWLMDCRNIAESAHLATELYREAILVPMMAKFVVFGKSQGSLEAALSIFCMTDDKEDKAFEHQEHFTEIAKSKDVQVIEGKSVYAEFGGNLVPISKSIDPLSLRFFAFKENRLPVNVKVKDPSTKPFGRISFLQDPKTPSTICNLDVALPGYADGIHDESSQNSYRFLKEARNGKMDTIHRVDLRISDIGTLLDSDWVKVAHELNISESDINLIQSEYPGNNSQQAMVMLRLWLNNEGDLATGNALERALCKCNREDIVNKCIFNVELVTDEVEQFAAKAALSSEKAAAPKIIQVDDDEDSEIESDEVLSSTLITSHEEEARMREGNTFNHEPESANSEDRLEGTDSRQIPTTSEMDESEDDLEKEVGHVENLVEPQGSQMHYKEATEEEENPGEIIDTQDIEHVELNHIERKSPSSDSFGEESGKLTTYDQTGDQSFQEEDAIQVLSEDVDRVSVESEGHDETDFRASLPINEEIEELHVQANFSLAEGKALPGETTREIVTDEKREEVEEELCQEVIIQRRRASISDKSSTNSSVHEDDDLDIEMAIEEQVNEQNNVDANPTSEIETLIQEIHSKGDSHDEIVEEVLDEVVLTKKLDQEVGSTSNHKDEKKSTESNASQRVDDSAFEVDEEIQSRIDDLDLETLDEEESDAYSFNDKLSQNVESSEREGSTQGKEDSKCDDISVDDEKDPKKEEVEKTVI